MSRYLQKISLRPFSEDEVWAGWDLEGKSGEIEGLICADQMSQDDLRALGVTEFQRIPKKYLDTVD